MTTVPPTGLRRKVAAATTLAVGGLALAAVPTSPASAADPASPTTVQVSVRTGGFAPSPGANNHGGSSTAPRVSKDGRYVVFAASGPVAPGHVQLQWQVLRRDRHLGTTELISKSSTGAAGNAGSHEPSISADGQVVAFRSYASNLVPGDTNKDTDAFVHDVRTGTTKRVSVNSAGAQVDGVGATNQVGSPSISADGRFVGFTATVGGLTADGSNDAHAYLHDLRTGGTEMVSRTAAGLPVGGHVQTPVSVSANGDFVAFASFRNAVTGEDNTSVNIYVRDRRAGQETTVAVGGEQWSDLSHSISADGRFVVYETTDADQTPGDTNGASDVFVHDLTTGTKQRVSVSSSGAQGNGHSSGATISADGRYVSFESLASNLVAGDTNNSVDVFRHDRTTGETIRVSLTADGAQAIDTRGSSRGSISPDGQHVYFESYDKTLTSVATHGYGQGFVHDLRGRYPALFAALGRTPVRAIRTETYRVPTVDIRTGPPLKITWTPASGKGSVVRQTAAVSRNAFTLRAPNRHGKFTVKFTYADNLLATRTITVPKPGTKKLVKSVGKGKKVTVRTVGVKSGQKVKVIFTPRARTGAPRTTRIGRTNRNGVLRVLAPNRRGIYRVVVKAGSSVLRQTTIRVR